MLIPSPGSKTVKSNANPGRTCWFLQRFNSAVTPGGEYVSDMVRALRTGCLLLVEIPASGGAAATLCRRRKVVWTLGLRCSFRHLGLWWTRPGRPRYLRVRPASRCGILLEQEVVRCAQLAPRWVLGRRLGHDLQVGVDILFPISRGDWGASRGHQARSFADL